MSIHRHCSFELPVWIDSFLDSWQESLQTTTQRMQLAIALAAENVRRETGGPFAALVVNEGSGELVSVGLNLVTRAGLSMAHAEIVALSLAQSALGHWDLSRPENLQLVTTCEPCAMCFGALPWSGIKSVVCGARKKDAESSGFDEGDKPDHWVRSLQRRGIVVQCSVLRSEAVQVLEQYRQNGGTIYNTDRDFGKN
jgi:tRNA(Arg) A34 adenosine deaminase TadA